MPYFTSVLSSVVFHPIASIGKEKFFSSARSLQSRPYTIQEGVDRSMGIPGVPAIATHHAHLLTSTLADRIVLAN